MRLRNLFFLGASFIAVSYPGFADDTLPDADAASHGVARVGILNGDVSVRRNDSGEYVAGAVNAPVVAGDSLATGPSGRIELQFNSANLLRIGHDSEVRLTEFIPNRIGMELARGTVTYRVLRNSGAQVEIGTPTVSVRPAGFGAVRVTVLEDGLTLITARSGQAEIYTPRGVETLPTGQTMIARGSASDPEFQITAPISRDEWDDWSDSRDRALESSRGSQYVNADIAGVADLDSYGQWVNDPNYGQVWNPRVDADWAPYRNGRWVSVDYYGWSWLGDEPWGWAPYHYGNWFYGPVGWCWYPGPIYSRYYWRPAVVGFFGFGGGSGGFGFGFGFGNVGWAPLAPFETFRPWYGRGRSFAVLNNVNIYGSFRNARHNGLTGIGAGNFAGGRSGRTFAVSQNQIGRAGMVSGGLPFRASGASQRFSDRPASFVPRGNAFSSRQFSSRGGAQAFGNTGRSTGGQPGARGLAGNGFGQTGQSGRGAAGLQAAPGNRDSGWSRFGGNRGGPAPIQNGRGSAGLQSTPGNRDSGLSRFGGNRGGPSPIQNGRGSAGLQSTPGNRDSGWSRFGGNRGGPAPIQNGRGSAGLQSTPGNRDSGLSRFGGNRGGPSPIQNGRGAAGLQSTPANRDSGWSRFGGNRGGPAPIQNGRGAAGLQSTPANRDSNWSRSNTRGGAQTIPQNGRGSAGFQSSPGNRDFGGNRYGRAQGGFATSAPTNPGYVGGSYRGGGAAMQRQYGSSARGSQPMAVPRQSPQVSRGFETRSSPNNNSFRGSGSAARSAPGYSGNNAGRGNSAPRSSGSSNGGGDRGGGGHGGKHGR